MLQTDIMINAGISESDIRQLQEAWSAYQTARKSAVRQKPHIICTGIYNAGKSTLLNALLDDEKFPTGDIPTTKATAQTESNGAVYTDTPGLNAAAEDDQETQSAYESADFILFVSSAENGGISESEALWLQRLRDRYTPEGLKLRITYVLTHCAQVDPEQLPGIRDKVCGDISKAVGFAPEQIFCVDSITYQEGTKAHEPLLITNSGIPQLQAYLSGRIKEAEKLLQQIKIAEMHQRQQTVLQKIRTCKEFCRQEMDDGHACTIEKKTIDSLFAEAKKELAQIASCPVTLYGGLAFKNGGRSFEGKDGGALRRQAKDSVRTFAANSIENARRSISTMFRRAKTDYGTTGIDSNYSKICDQANRLLGLV